MNITDIIRYMALAAVSVLALSCSKDEPQSAGDSDDCYDVYFEGGQSDDYEVDQSAQAALTFTVARSNVKGDIIVPLKLEASETSIFAMTSLQFADGQSKSSFTLYFDNAKVQKVYDVKISIEDPRYARVYGLNDTSIEFTVVREDYDVYAYGYYNSNLLVYPSSTWEQYLEYSPTLDTYRFPDLFTDGYDVKFKWDGGLNVTMLEDTFDTGMGYQDAEGNSLGNITGDIVKAEYDPATGMFSFTYEYNVVGYGGFGELMDQYLVLLSI